jgi:hypothetical protein
MSGLADLEIGRTLVGHAPRLVVDGHALGMLGRKRLQQCFERRPVGMLGLLVERCLAQRLEIAIKDVAVGH